MSLYYEMYLMFAMTTDVLEKKYAGLSDTERITLADRGRKLVEEARKNGVKRMYYEKRALAVYAAMKMDGWDFRP